MDEFTLSAIGVLCNAIIKIVCFTLGFFTVKLGYQLIKDGVKGEFKFSADYKGLKGGLVSSSPGLLFLLLGILLIGYAMGTEQAVSLDTESGSHYEQKRQFPNETIKDQPVEDSI
ncbi:hypothetical protein AM493_19215 [Flavobacterium akiainvivens]|uniref:Uncharacterized protein n=1 Tax=Flavobacterium akiainvivens TaxID=1202724 RepID=A0A0M8MKY1_9FLAO|nr:hypothetical protein [Flavobacterium akiainvivens]KOS07947.1 hypothetical protein AM493_19215 [Flavobacterium akiainvivens]SFQ29453.1 hypothetical protein SAMN05444144_102425 [Flavobacterium akiainvivens]